MFLVPVLLPTLPDGEGAKSGVKNVGHVDGVDNYHSAVDAVPASRVGKRG